MKTNKILLMLTLFVLSTSITFAQVRVNANGESKLGNEWANNDPNNEATHEFFGLNGNAFRPGTLISLGDYGSSASGGANVYIAEAYGWDSDQLDLHGKNGIYFTVNGTNGSIIGAELTSVGDLIVTKDVSAVAYQTRSDIRLKTNIRNLNGALTSIMKLQGLIYDFKSIREDSVLAILNAIDAKSEKDIRDLAIAKKGYEAKKLENLNHLGFSAQEVQLIFPQLVKTDKDGFLSVNYTALVPVAVEAIKEQQTVIDTQKAIIDVLQKDILAIKLKLGMR